MFRTRATSTNEPRKKRTRKAEAPKNTHTTFRPSRVQHVLALLLQQQQQQRSVPFLFFYSS